MADWEIALDKQLATWLWMHTQNGIDYIASYLDSVRRRYPEEVPAWERMERDTVTSLWRADPVYVTPEMLAVVKHALATFEAEPLREDDLLLPNGFAYLPQAVHIRDVRGKTLAIRAIGWAQAMYQGYEAEEGGRVTYDESKRGVLVTFFSQFGDEDDYFHAMTPDQRTNGFRYYGDSLMVAHQLPLVYGETPRTDLSATRIAMEDSSEERSALDPQEVSRSAMEVFMLCQVLWRLMQQRIGVGFRQRAPRGARRRVEQAGWKEKYVTVVTLRRPRQAHQGESHPVDWTHRWFVSGHWRWQPYGDGTHRQIWINPYVKGPDDKPLVIRGARVFRLAR